MSDIADRADVVIALEINHSLAAVRQMQVITPNGHCCFCDELVALPGRFCDVDCRDDYDREREFLVRTGKFF